MGIAGKVALVTGSSSGIGKATAIAFGREKAKVALVGRSPEPLNLVESSIKKDGGTAVSIPADVTEEADVEGCVRKAVQAYGGLDILVNAAGILFSGSIEQTTLKQWDEMFNINVRSVFHMMQQALPHLIKSKGNVINVSSVTGLRAFPNILAYCVSKAAVDQLTRCAALELAPKGVRVNAVNPGVVGTNLHRRAGMDEGAYGKFLEHSKTTHPLGRVGKPEEIADLILYLASPRASWVTGATYSIDGGRAQTCLR